VLEGELNETQFLVNCESHGEDERSSVLLPHHLRAIKLNNTIYIPRWFFDIYLHLLKE
jgi:hypothetical protein